MKTKAIDSDNSFNEHYGVTMRKPVFVGFLCKFDNLIKMESTHFQH